MQDFKLILPSLYMEHGLYPLTWLHLSVPNRIIDIVLGGNEDINTS